MSRLASVRTNAFTHVITVPKNLSVCPSIGIATPAAADGGDTPGKDAAAGNHPLGQKTTAHPTYADVPPDPEPVLVSVARKGQHDRKVPRLVSKDDHLMTDAPW